VGETALRPNRSWEPLRLPADWPPTLTVVIDTEEEFDWDADFDATATSTVNIEHQPLAQAVMDRYGVIPTYVVDYPVAATPASVRILRSIAESGRCEIGAHLHPWVCPPHEGPIDAFHSYPGNLPARLEREKLERLAQTIKDAFGERPVVYKAGRYGLGPASFESLRALGFRVDVSVVPHTDFSGQAGPDFTSFPAAPCRTETGITELPLSVHFTGALAAAGPKFFPKINRGPLLRLRLPGVLSRLGLLQRLRLSPEGHSLGDMIYQTRAALAHGERYFMLTYHSSSLLPWANGYVRSEAERTEFLAKLEGFFSFFLRESGGQAKAVAEIADALANIKAETSTRFRKPKTETLLSH
jgi:hypothetical protein